MTGFWVFAVLVTVLVGITACIWYRARKDQKRYVPPPDYSGAVSGQAFYQREYSYQPPLIVVDTPMVIETVGRCDDSVADATGTTDTWGGCDTSSGGDTQ